MVLRMYTASLVFAKTHAQARILYDRVLKTNIYFEFTTLLNHELGTSRAENSKSNNNKKTFVTCLEFSRS